MERAGFPKKWGATMLWGRDPEPWSWYFRETNRSYPHAYQVWRADFRQDTPGQCPSVRRGRQRGCTVTAALVESNWPYAVKFRTGDGSENIIEADWIIDATDRPRCSSRTLGMRRWDDQFRNMAIYGYFSGSRRLPAPDSTNIFIESYEHGWAWNIPLANDIASVGVVIDSEVGQHGIRQSGVREYYRRQLDSTRHTRDMLSAAEIISGPAVVKTGRTTSQRMAGDGGYWWRRGLFRGPPIFFGSTPCHDVRGHGRRVRPRGPRATAPFVNRRPGIRRALPNRVQPLPRARSPLLRQQSHDGVLLLGSPPHLGSEGR